MRTLSSAVAYNAAITSVRNVTGSGLCKLKRLIFNYRLSRMHRLGSREGNWRTRDGVFLAALMETCNVNQNLRLKRAIPRSNGRWLIPNQRDRTQVLRTNLQPRPEIIRKASLSAHKLLLFPPLHAPSRNTSSA